jgi:hypothetical protein
MLVECMEPHSFGASRVATSGYSETFEELATRSVLIQQSKSKINALPDAQHWGFAFQLHVQSLPTELSKRMHLTDFKAMQETKSDMHTCCAGREGRPLTNRIDGDHSGNERVGAESFTVQLTAALKFGLIKPK